MARTARRRKTTRCTAVTVFFAVLVLVALGYVILIERSFSWRANILSTATKRFYHDLSSKKDTILRYTGIDPRSILSNFMKFKRKIVYDMDKRGKAIERYRKELPTDTPRPGTEQAEKFKTALLTSIKTFPSPSGRNLKKKPGHKLRIAIVRGDGTGWVVGASAQVAGAELVFDDKSKVGCPTDASAWDICWVDGWVGGGDGMGNANGGHFKLRNDPKHLHAPLYNSYNIVGEKRTLLRSLTRAALHFKDPSYLQVMPRSFELPKQRGELIKAVKRGRNSDLWIAKPSYGSTARGIYVFNKKSKTGVPDENAKGQDAAWIIQEYLNPLLLRGHKFDMRLHLFVRLNPLRIYIHQDSVVRLASEKYVPNGKLANKCMHITNQAYQQPNCRNYAKNTDLAQSEKSHLWNLKTLLRYLSRTFYRDDERPDNNSGDIEESLEEMLDMDETTVSKEDAGSENKGKKLKYSSPEILWEKIQEVVVKSVLASDEWRPSKMKYKEDNGFSFLGPDVAIDNDGNPFLLEINAFPTTAVGSPLGVQLKLGMLTDMYRMLGAGGYNDVERKYNVAVKHKIASYCDTKKISLKIRRRLLKRKGSIKRKLAKCSKKERQILMQYEDEKAYSGSWELAFPTRIGLLDTYSSITSSKETKKWVPGHYNQLLWDYILANGE